MIHLIGRPRPDYRPSQSSRLRHRAWLRIEQLETRTLLSVYPLSPLQVRHAYGFDQVSGNGAGQTIGIVDAYNDPNTAKDLDTFDQTYSLTAGGPTLYQQYGPSSSVLTKATPQGKTRNNSGWAQEISLDVEWAHAIAPGAHILLVEAANNGTNNLLSAADYAVSHGASVVSMSWGGGEFSGETGLDGHFLHTGVTFVASSGDTGSVVEWPAASPNVVAVGGTSLNTDTSGDYLSETGWSGSGGGISAYEPKPTYQSAVTQSLTQRTNPDVAYNADPYTGFAVYDSYTGGGGWGQYGGTSAGAPQWAALIAIADQQRVAAGKGTLSGTTQTLPTLYTMLPTNYHDITSGSSGTYSAGPGYDLVTGQGTPRAPQVIAALAGTTLAASRVAPPTPSTSPDNGRHNPKTVVMVTINPLAALVAQAASPGPGVSGPVSMPALTGAAVDPRTVLPPMRLIESHQESGGGENSLVPGDVDTPADWSDPEIVIEVNAAHCVPSPETVALAAPLPSSSGSWRESSTAYFADERFVTAQASGAFPASARLEDSASGYDPLAGLAGIALVLGGYLWKGGRRTEDEDRLNRRV